MGQGGCRSVLLQWSKLVDHCWLLLCKIKMQFGCYGNRVVVMSDSDPELTVRSTNISARCGNFSWSRPHYTIPRETEKRSSRSKAIDDEGEDSLDPYLAPAWLSKYAYVRFRHKSYTKAHEWPHKAYQPNRETTTLTNEFEKSTPQSDPYSALIQSPVTNHCASNDHAITRLPHHRHKMLRQWHQSWKPSSHYQIKETSKNGQTPKWLKFIWNCTAIPFWR